MRSELRCWDAGMLWGVGWKGRVMGVNWDARVFWRVNWDTRMLECYGGVNWYARVLQ